MVEVFKGFLEDRVEELLPHVLALRKWLLMGFSHFSRSEKKCGVRQPVRRSPAGLFFTWRGALLLMESGGLWPWHFAR